MTNNPAKVDALRSLGVAVVGRVPVIVAPTAFSAGYLETKRARMAHELPNGYSTNMYQIDPTSVAEWAYLSTVRLLVETGGARPEISRL